jgi:hypothetical protein
MSEELQLLRYTKTRIDQVFALLNSYAKDPYNMGASAYTQARILPTDILAETYMILAPVSLKLTEHLEIQDNDRCLKCGAKKATHIKDHLCRMHIGVGANHRPGFLPYCLVCGTRPRKTR